MPDVSLMLFGILFSSVGIGYFIYGKKQTNPVIRYTGLVLIVYPYFVQNLMALILVGVALLFVPKFIIQAVQPGNSA